MLGTLPPVDPTKSLGYSKRPRQDDPPATCRVPPSPASVQSSTRPQHQRHQPIRASSNSARPICPSSTEVGLQSAPAIAPKTESEIWWETASESLPARLWLNSLHKKAARHVRLPRTAMSGVPGSQHPIYTIENSPFTLVKKKCLEAGLELQGTERVKKGTIITTVWKGMGHDVGKPVRETR